MYLFNRNMFYTNIYLKITADMLRGKKNQKTKTPNLEGKISDHLLLWKYYKVLQKFMRTYLQCLSKNLLQVLEMEKKHFFLLKAFWTISNIYPPVPRQRLAFQLIRNAHKRADLNEHVRVHLILRRMKRKKFLFKGGSKRASSSLCL